MPDKWVSANPSLLITCRVHSSCTCFFSKRCISDNHTVCCVIDLKVAAYLGYVTEATMGLASGNSTESNKDAFLCRRLSLTSRPLGCWLRSTHQQHMILHLSACLSLHCHVPPVPSLGDCRQASNDFSCAAYHMLKFSLLAKLPDLTLFSMWRITIICATLSESAGSRPGLVLHHILSA